MSDYNHIAICGRLTRDPELRTTSTGKSVTNFTVAVNRSKADDNGTADFFDVTCWGQLADLVTNYCAKGRRVIVSGRQNSREFTGSDGAKRKVWEINAQEVQFLDSPTSERNDDGYRSQPTSPVPAADEYDPFADE